VSTLVICIEEYTSKICGSCGEINRNLETTIDGATKDKSQLGNQADVGAYIYDTLL